LGYFLILALFYYALVPGVGKSTLLRHIAMREVPIPPHITILFVEQEVIGDDTLAIDSVLKADVWRDHLLKEEAQLNAKLAELEAQGGDDKAAEDAKDELSSRLVDVHARLADMDAESGPARAASLLAGNADIAPWSPNESH
jgi:ATP-binding cassette, subfamily F, member 3